jgi:HPr kinase/phosphorylase
VRQSHGVEALVIKQKMAVDGGHQRRGVRQKPGVGRLMGHGVRGIGLLDIRCIFGETAVRRKMRLKLIVHLVRRETLERDYERIPYEPLKQDVLGVPVRKVVIQVVAGRNIAVLVEAAVRNTILQLRGIDTYQEFVERQRNAMDTGD